MNCPQCGEVCNGHAGFSAIPEEDSDAAPGIAADSEAWRDELSARLNRYRSRRKVRPPRYPSLSLRFEMPESQNGSAMRSLSMSSARFEPVSNQALALDGAPQQPVAEVELAPPPAIVEPAASTSFDIAPRPAPAGKIIEFPRISWAPPVPPPDQLAEPVSDKPRILDVPEVELPPPALGGITIESVRNPEPEKRLGIDLPLEGTPLGLRIIAAMVDTVIIAGACAVFGYIFWNVSGFRPPLPQLIGLATGIPCLSWAVYQYLMIVYAGTTPGLRLARLDLVRFDGSRANRRLRRWRVLAAWLSAASLGMGYVWVLLDEENLCWHDRITRTCFAPKKH